MSSHMLSFLFCLFLITNLPSSQSSSTAKVVGVFELIRHGARAPLITYNDKAKNIYFGTKRSQLTINGCRQHLLLGRWIRRRYVEGDVSKLLNKTLDPEQVTVVSSPLQRTMFSAASHVMGIFPYALLKYDFSGKHHYRNDDVPPIEGYQVDPRDGKEITIGVVDNDRDTMFRVNLCKRKGSEKILKQEFKNSLVFFNITKEELKQAIDDVNKVYGNYFLKEHFDEKNFYRVRTLNIMLKVLRPYEYHSDMKLKLRHSTLEIITKAILNRLYGYRIKESQAKKLLASSMLDTLSQYLNHKTQGIQDSDLFILSGHDSNIINILVNLFDREFLEQKIQKAVEDKRSKRFLIPPLASSLIFELVKFENDPKHYVRLVYDGEDISEGFAGIIKRKGAHKEFLDFEDFDKLLKSRIDPSYREMDCSKTKK